MHKLLSLALGLLTVSAIAQKTTFTHQDSLKGSITPERAWWDVSHYDLKVDVDPGKQFISGTNTITYKVIDPYQKIQIDLQEPMKLLSAIQDGKELVVKKDGAAHFISLKAKQKKNAVNKLEVKFEGKPVVGKRLPWDGGWTWQEDNNGKTFAANANQGIGSSIWWPNKDIPYDEVEGLDFYITVPKGLMGVGNGKIIDSTSIKDKTTFHWAVENPINNYGVSADIADYAHFSETYEGEKGSLDLNFYVLKKNLKKAKEQFKQVPKMLEAFEHWFGPYPFYEDGYKLVEVPYLGMEHQSNVTYGNAYGNGYLGRDLSGSGWGLKFDYIIIHESGHEWFANNITNKDVADMWIHESFTTYSENLFVDYFYGKEASSDYVIGMRNAIRNDRPIIGTYGVDHEGSGDMYFKGANILHTLRQLIEDDEKWREILRGLNKEFYHQTVTTAQVENYISKKSGIDLTEFWNQYLRTTMIPELEYTINGTTLKFRYADIVEGFDMPIQIMVNQEKIWIYPAANWNTKSFDEPISEFEIDRNFYIESEELD
ncbi:peptidase M1-like protein [Leeuwenhoekiella aestuarii]|uniref:Peptidase M1-like protein n=1 Tax=Leeuwenhoekiella aestuarii TaxID=2249426 RepID=A0A4Q0NX15_9FLAO|nr:M1 family metallopeptidase [Leeuwenhoekiella aestuarii]RXG16119.1 peptidase M1-like protein [Leeuwenhoekiella aestuarii]RXG16813.1 peptidase M1-like protein [Leeuwenhoekiella aestuarii]